MDITNSYNNRIVGEGLTFDDVLLVPAESNVLPPQWIPSPSTAWPSP